MQTDFQVEFVPLPAEREGEWRQAIELIAEIMKGYFMNMQIAETNQYRFAWIFPGDAETHYGTFLFDDPADARGTQNTMQMMFRNAVIWLEDREHNRVEIPRY
jgi:hypothetical protein